MNRQPKRGDIYLVQLRPRSGSEQQGTRPMLILSRNTFSAEVSWQTLSGIPLSTGQVQQRRGHICVFLPKGEGGLEQDSVALCHQITTLDKSKLVHYIGSLPSTRLEEIEHGIKLYLDMA